jgi:hypothetical protein
VHDVLNISTDGSFENVELLDLIGRQQISESILGKKEVTVDVQELAAGLHVVILKGRGKNHAFRIIKK